MKFKWSAAPGKEHPLRMGQKFKGIVFHGQRPDILEMSLSEMYESMEGMADGPCYFEELLIGLDAEDGRITIILDPLSIRE